MRERRSTKFWIVALWIAFGLFCLSASLMALYLAHLEGWC